MFTPLTSLGGGLLIGLGAVLLMLGLGRVFGATGIVSGAVFFENRDEMTWRLALIGGIIVGLGASLGSGCTSGHGVCGLSRLSVRSLVAVPTFMATAAITVFLIRHVAGG